MKNKKYTLEEIQNCITIIEELVEESIKRLQDRTFKPMVQKEELASYAPKPEKKEDFVN